MVTGLKTGNVLAPLVQDWLDRIDRAAKVRKTQFDDFANEAMQFFDSDGEFVWERLRKSIDKSASFGEAAAAVPFPSIRMNPNRVSEMVQVFGPVTYYQNHSRTVHPKTQDPQPIEMFGNPMDPMVQMQYQFLMQQQLQQNSVLEGRAKLLEQLLSSIPNETNLLSVGRAVIQEAFIKGASWIAIEMETLPGGDRKMPCARQVDPFDVVVDPAKCWDSVRWIARRRRMLYWEAEEFLGLPQDALKDKCCDLDGYTTTQEAEDARAGRSQGNEEKDIFEFWEVFSKRGMGHKGGRAGRQLSKLVTDILESWGEYSYVCVAKGCDYILNIPEDTFVQDVWTMQSVIAAPDGTIEEESPDLALNPGYNPEQLFVSTQWPIPFWVDRMWPLRCIGFLEKPQHLYPISLLKPGISYLRFLHFAYSYLATRTAVSSSAIVALAKEGEESLKAKLLEGAGNTFNVMEISKVTGVSLKELVEVFTLPSIDPAMLAVIDKVEVAFDKSTGLSELLFGISSRADRSAAESNNKQGNIQIRVDDFSRAVDTAFGDIARMQAMAARWFMDRNDVAPYLGPIGSAIWASQIMTSDLEQVAREYEFQVADGSSRRPNKETRVEQLNQALQVLGPILQSWAFNTGQVDPLNALLSDWGKENQVEKIENYLLVPPPPPPMPMQPAPEEQGMPV